jgi:hypothetical protein
MELIRDGLLFLPLALIVTIGGFLTKRNRTGSQLPQSSASVSHAD